MKRLSCLAALSALLAAPARGQTPFPPPPDHWLTLDSLTQAVGLTADQQDKARAPYAALNAAVKKAAERRRAFREGMMARFGGQAPTPEQRDALRPTMDSMRAELLVLQQEVDKSYDAIRALLAGDQQAKFDALPKPIVTPPRMRQPKP